jgi:antitoxin component YwqK of YwqJK toxin-antitoxin module
MKRLLLLTVILLTSCSNEPEVFSGPYLTRDGILYNQETNLAITGVALLHYESGGLMAQTFYLNGLKHGVAKEFYLNGQLAELHNYQSGALHGSKESFSENGFLRTAENYEMGKLLDQNGGLMTGLVEYGKGSSITKQQYKNGLKDGHGGYFVDSMELVSFCYREGVFLDGNDSYCGQGNRSVDEVLKAMRDKKKKGD